MSELFQKLLGTKTLPSPPGVAMEVMRVNQDDEVSISELATIISRDPALAAKLLRMANSSKMGRPGQVADIEDAVMVLGTRSVNLIALSFSLAATQSGARSTAFDYTRFWTASACNTIAARLLAERYEPRIKDEAFLAGLLCDFAQMLLAEAAPKEYESVLRSHEASGGPIHLVEQAELGTDHASLGSQILQHWGLPERIWESIGAHHDPTRVVGDDEQTLKLAKLLHLASTCGDLYLSGADQGADELVALGNSYFEMGPDDCQSLVDDLHEGVAEFLDILDLETVDPALLSEIRAQASEKLVRESLELNQRVQSISGTLDRISQQNILLERRARMDPLTGLHNRLFMEEYLDQQLELIVESGGSLGLVIMDVDYFKDVNDSHGHLAGDKMLKEIAALIAASLGTDHTAIRCGGDEFIAICVDVSTESLLEKAQVVRRAIEDHVMQFGSREIKTTLSVGGAVVKDQAAAGARTALLAAADDELYKAKARGRNRVFVTAIESDGR